MNWDHIEDNWQVIKTRAKDQWNELTADDLTVIEGHRDELEGRLQSHYGYAKARVQAEVDSWMCSMER